MTQPPNKFMDWNDPANITIRGQSVKPLPKTWLWMRSKFRRLFRVAKALVTREAA